MAREPTRAQRRGVTVQINEPGSRPVLRVELFSGVGTVLLQQAIASDPTGPGEPYALLQANISYGIDGAHFSVTADWQMGTRIVIPCDYIDLSLTYVAVDTSRLPMVVTVSAAVVDGAPAPPTPWGFTVRCNELTGPGGSQVIQVPQGAHNVALFAPTVASWGGFYVRQQASQAGGIILTDTPVDTTPTVLMPGCRWIYIENNTGIDLRPLVRFELA